MIHALALHALVTATVAPSNVVLSSCDARSFALRVEAPSLGNVTRGELVNQLGIGLVSRGYALCIDADPTNVILIDELDDGSLDVLARYHGRQARRVLEPERRDGKAAGLTLAVAVEELVLIVTDPNQPAEHAPAIAAPAPVASRPFLRLGAEAQAVAYQNTRIGIGVGLRADREIIDRLRLGVALAARQLESEAVEEGRVRYRVLDVQLSVHAVVARGERLALAAGVAIAPALAQGAGRPEEGSSGATVTRGVLTARALLDLEARITKSQTLALRLGAGRPLQALTARTEAGRPLGGLAEWELLLTAAWLWSFY